MRKRLFAFMAFSCVLISAPFALAMQSTSSQTPKDINQTNQMVIENLCDPNIDAESYQQSTSFPLDYQQLERVRIELLERGFNPGFNPERETTIDTQTIEAVARFQSDYHLPVTGQIDATTLAALNVPIEKSPTISQETIRRAKPSK